MMQHATCTPLFKIPLVSFASPGTEESKKKKPKRIQIPSDSENNSSPEMKYYYL